MSILPDWETCHARALDGTASFLEAFIDDYEPANEEDAALFRRELAAVLAFAQEEARQETRLQHMEEIAPCPGACYPHPRGNRSPERNAAMARGIHTQPDDLAKRPALGRRDRARG